jgi:hypothetical protein
MREIESDVYLSTHLHSCIDFDYYFDPNDHFDHVIDNVDQTADYYNYIDFGDDNQTSVCYHDYCCP